MYRIIDPKFKLGKVVETKAVFLDPEAEFGEFCRNCLQRHSQGDWGDMDEEDKELNDEAFRDGDGRLFSSYNYKDGRKLWIITEADHSVTTLLYPEDY